VAKPGQAIASRAVGLMKNGQGETSDAGEAKDFEAFED
jgi:hypothetical protein